MNREQVRYLMSLVEAYLNAYRERMPDDFKVARLRADRQIRFEYGSVLDFVENLPVSRERYSKKTIEGYVDDLLTAALKDPSRVAQEVQALAGVFNHDPETRLYIPVEGVTIDAPAYDIGALRLVRMDGETFERLIISPFADVMRDNPHYPEKDEKAGFVDIHRQEMRSMQQRVCAEIATALDIPKTFDFAKDIAVASLCDFLQFAASLFLAHDKRLKIGWATDAGVTWRHAFAASDGLRKQCNRKGELVSTGHRFEIDAKRIAKLNELGLDRIANLVGRERPDEYSELLQRAIRWFAKGEREDNPDDRKLAYVTAIDLFFSKVGRGATERICRGFAFALAPKADAVPDLARYMFHVFASRAVTSHEGEFDLTDETDLRSLRHYVQQCIIAMTNHPFKTKAEVAVWIAGEEAKLSPVQMAELHDATDWRKEMV